MPGRTRSEYRIVLTGAGLQDASPLPTDDGRFTLRPVTPADRDALARVMLAGYLGSVDDEGEGPEEAEAAIDEYFASMLWPHGRVIELDDELVAFSFAVVVRDRHYVDPVVTDPVVKRRGLGRAAVRAVLDSLRDAGITEVGATITDGNVPSERLFASLGFERVGPWPPPTAE
jgi:RimJ/RimL family protein N-acetyltransferase